MSTKLILLQVSSVKDVVKDMTTFGISELVTCNDQEMLIFVPYGSDPGFTICTLEKTM